MPVHDWTRVNAGTFHDFHSSWIVHLKEALNGGLLPPAYYALAEQHAGQVITDEVILRWTPDEGLLTASPRLGKGCRRPWGWRGDWDFIPRYPSGNDLRINCFSQKAVFFTNHKVKEVNCLGH